MATNTNGTNGVNGSKGPTLPTLEEALATLDPLVARCGRRDWPGAAKAAFRRHLGVGKSVARDVELMEQIEQEIGPLPRSPELLSPLLSALARVGRELHLLAEAEDRAAEDLWDMAVHGVPVGRGLRGALAAARKRVELVRDAANTVDGLTTIHHEEFTADGASGERFDKIDGERFDAIAAGEPPPGATPASETPRRARSARSA